MFLSARRGPAFVRLAIERKRVRDECPFVSVRGYIVTMNHFYSGHKYNSSILVTRLARSGAGAMAAPFAIYLPPLDWLGPSVGGRAQA